jgi:hypothetical protein
MPRTLQLDLSADQQRELKKVRDHHPQPYMREKAAALLKIAAGQPGLQVAHHGLLKRRDSDTIYRWVARYQAEGVDGLRVRTGRGRKPAFSPSLPGRPSGESSPAAGVAHCA